MLCNAGRRKRRESECSKRYLKEDVIREHIDRPIRWPTPWPSGRKSKNTYVNFTSAFLVVQLLSLLLIRVALLCLFVCFGAAIASAANAYHSDIRRWRCTLCRVVLQTPIVAQIPNWRHRTDRKTQKHIHATSTLSGYLIQFEHFMTWNNATRSTAAFGTYLLCEKNRFVISVPRFFLVQLDQTLAWNTALTYLTTAAYHPTLH